MLFAAVCDRVLPGVERAPEEVSPVLVSAEGLAGPAHLARGSRVPQARILVRCEGVEVERVCGRGLSRFRVCFALDPSANAAVRPLQLGPEVQVPARLIHEIGQAVPAFRQAELAVVETLGRELEQPEQFIRDDQVLSAAVPVPGVVVSAPHVNPLAGGLPGKLDERARTLPRRPHAGIGPAAVRPDDGAAVTGLRPGPLGIGWFKADPASLVIEPAAGRVERLPVHTVPDAERK